MAVAGATNGGAAVHAFIIELEDRPGSLADLCAGLGERGINIRAVSGLALKAEGGAAIVTNDDAATRSVLDDRGARYREVELVAASLEDRPGSLGEAARRLADRGINIDALLATGMQGSQVTVAFGVDDPESARAALGELAAAGSSAV
jgi:hypothetical protein